MKDPASDSEPDILKRLEEARRESDVQAAGS
jgi:hypothetical protein